MCETSQTLDVFRVPCLVPHHRPDAGNLSSTRKWCDSLVPCSLVPLFLTALSSLWFYLWFLLCSGGVTGSVLQFHSTLSTRSSLPSDALQEVQSPAVPAVPCFNKRLHSSQCRFSRCSQGSTSQRSSVASVFCPLSPLLPPTLFKRLCDLPPSLFYGVLTSKH